jgi:hypothetical protein
MGPWLAAGAWMWRFRYRRIQIAMPQGIGKLALDTMAVLPE